MSWKFIFKKQSAKKIANLGLLFAFIIIAGCATVSVKQTFDLSNRSLNLNKQSGTIIAKPIQILVVNPSALKSLDGQDIMVQGNSASIAYLKGAQWADRLPSLVQARFVRAFEDTQKLAGVGRPGDGLAINYQIISDIRSFGINISNGSQRAEVEIVVKVLDDRTGTVKATQIFKAQSAVSSANNDAYAKALETAFSEITAQIVNWTLSKI